jgi:hypothetical protein
MEKFFFGGKVLPKLKIIIIDGIRILNCIIIFEHNELKLPKWMGHVIKFSLWVFA